MSSIPSIPISRPSTRSATPVQNAPRPATPGAAAVEEHGHDSDTRSVSDGGRPSFSDDDGPALPGTPTSFSTARHLAQKPGFDPVRFQEEQMQLQGFQSLTGALTSTEGGVSPIDGGAR